MKIRSCSLAVIIMVLAVCCNSLRSTHNFYENSTWGCNAADGTKNILSSGQYVESKIPKSDNWQWLYVQGTGRLYTQGYNRCFILQKGNLYIAGKSARIVPNDLVDSDDWQYALVADQKYIQNKPSRYTGTITTEPCAVNGKVVNPDSVMFKCTQIIKGVTYTSYLVNIRKQTVGNWIESLFKTNYGNERTYLDTKFVGLKYLSANFKKPSDFCFTF